MAQTMSPYEDEIDLRRLVQVVLARWYWIVIATVLTAAVALGVSMIMPEQFRATSAVAIVKPDVIFRFEARIATEVEVPESKGVPDLAMGDSVLQAVIDSPAGADLDAEDKFVDVLRKRFETSLVDTVIKFSVEDTDPTRAAALSNAWGEATVQKLNELYLPSSQEQGMFAQQAEGARQVWNDAQDALIAFQESNPEQVLSQRLYALESKLAWTLEQQRVLDIRVQDANAVLKRLADQDIDSTSDLTEDLLLLELNARSLLSDPGAPLDLQLQFQGNSILAMPSTEQMGLVEGLLLAMKDQETFLIESIAGIEDDIYDLQGRLSEAQEQRIYLEQERDLARDAYQALARKAQEANLTSQGQDAVARVASRAAVPSEDVSPRVMLNTALGGVLGFIVGITWVFLVDWWRGEE